MLRGVSVAGARQQSRRAAVSSLTLSCFDRQHTCILVESLVADDLAAPCAAHTRRGGWPPFPGPGAAWNASPWRMLWLDQTADGPETLPGLCCVWAHCGSQFRAVTVLGRSFCLIFFRKKRENVAIFQFSIVLFIFSYQWFLTQPFFSNYGIKKVEESWLCHLFIPVWSSEDI